MGRDYTKAVRHAWRPGTFGNLDAKADRNGENYHPRRVISRGGLTRRDGTPITSRTQTPDRRTIARSGYMTQASRGLSVELDGRESRQRTV